MATPSGNAIPPRVLVACVGNILRRDDGFAIAVAALLDGRLPDGTDLIETGIGSLAIVHQLMDGYDALIVVDTVDRAATPGTVFVLVPEVPEVTEPTFEDWQSQPGDLHLAEPSRILRLARAAGVLPEHVLLVGCQPRDCEAFGDALSEPVRAAVPAAAERVCALAEQLLRDARPTATGLSPHHC